MGKRNERKRGGGIKAEGDEVQEKMIDFRMP